MVSSKFNPAEWHQSNETHYMNAFREVENGRKVRNVSHKLAKDVAYDASKTQKLVREKIGSRIKDVASWRAEVEKERGCVIAEMEALLHFKELVEKALTATQRPLAVPKKCLAYRTNRAGIDLVKDMVEKQLLKEVQLIEASQAALKRTLDQVIDQYRRLESVKKRLDKDSLDKHSALKIDNYCHGLNNYSSSLGYHKFAVEMDPNFVSLPEWESFSYDNITRARWERKMSENLRKKVNELLIKTMNELKEMYDAVNLAMNRRVMETSEAKKNLKNHLKRVMDEMDKMKENIDMLKRSIYDKEKYMQVAQTRLEKRAYRPNMELCRDVPKFRLVDEVRELEAALESLKRRLQDAVRAYQALEQQKLALEQDVAVKTTSMEIDRDLCYRMRQGMSWQPFLLNTTVKLKDSSCCRQATPPRLMSRDSHRPMTSRSIKTAGSRSGKLEGGTRVYTPMLDVTSPPASRGSLKSSHHRVFTPMIC